jgi:PIN domain
MRTNYVMIDYENVQPESLAALNSEQFKVKVFVGATQKNVTIKFAKALQPMGDRAEYIEISKSGKNALDFHIAFYIGQLAAADPTAYFHVISGDKGYEPLIKHLKDKTIFAALEKSINDIPLLKVLNAKTPQDRATLVMEKLRSNPGNIPTTVKGFSSIIKKALLDTAGDEEVKSIIAFMEDRKDISVKSSKVTFNLEK